MGVVSQNFVLAVDGFGGRNEVHLPFSSIAVAWQVRNQTTGKMCTKVKDSKGALSHITGATFATIEHSLSSLGIRTVDAVSTDQNDQTQYLLVLKETELKGALETDEAVVSVSGFDARDKVFIVLDDEFGYSLSAQEYLALKHDMVQAAQPEVLLA